MMCDLSACNAQIDVLDRAMLHLDAADESLRSIASLVANGTMQNSNGSDIVVDACRVKTSYIGDCSVSVGTFSKPMTYPEHCHNSWEIVIVVSGLYTIEIDGATRHLLPLDYLAIPAYTTHRIECIEPGEILGICIPPDETYAKSRK